MTVWDSLGVAMARWYLWAMPPGADPPRWSWVLYEQCLELVRRAGCALPNKFAWSDADILVVQGPSQK